MVAVWRARLCWSDKLLRRLHLLLRQRVLLAMSTSELCENHHSSCNDHDHDYNSSQKQHHNICADYNLSHYQHLSQVKHDYSTANDDNNNYYDDDYDNNCGTYHDNFYHPGENKHYDRGTYYDSSANHNNVHHNGCTDHDRRIHDGHCCC